MTRFGSIAVNKAQFDVTANRDSVHLSVWIKNDDSPNSEALHEALVRVLTVLLADHTKGVA